MVINYLCTKKNVTYYFVTVFLKFIASLVKIFESLKFYQLIFKLEIKVF